jgi:hypothetical protein
MADAQTNETQVVTILNEISLHPTVVIPAHGNSGIYQLNLQSYILKRIFSL